MQRISERARQVLGLGGYKYSATPENVDEISLSCPYEEQYILRMPIRVDGKEYKIPREIEWVIPMLSKAMDYQKTIVNIEHSFCYVTVRHGNVKSETDDEWHVDGFSTKISHIPEQNYIWSDIFPTQFVVQSFSFPEDFDPLRYNVNHFLESQIDVNNIRSCENNHIYCLDPYILHRRPHIPIENKRTFVRISFVPIEINDINNTQNPLIPRQYDKDGVLMRDELDLYQLK